MAKIQVEGLEELITGLRKLSDEARNINKGALGEGASVAVAHFAEAVESLPTHADKITGDEHYRRIYGVTEDEKAQLVDSVGIAKFRKDNSGWNTSIGVSGYISTHSPKYGNQVPARMLLDAVENGTDFRRPAHVMSKAQRGLKGEVVEAMEKYIDEKTKEIIS